MEDATGQVEVGEGALCALGCTPEAELRGIAVPLVRALGPSAGAAQLQSCCRAARASAGCLRGRGTHWA